MELLCACRGSIKTIIKQNNAGRISHLDPSHSFRERGRNGNSSATFNREQKLESGVEPLEFISECGAKLQECRQEDIHTNGGCCIRRVGQQDGLCWQFLRKKRVEPLYGRVVPKGDIANPYEPYAVLVQNLCCECRECQDKAGLSHCASGLAANGPDEVLGNREKEGCKKTPWPELPKGSVGGQSLPERQEGEPHLTPKNSAPETKEEQENARQAKGHSGTQ